MPRREARPCAQRARSDPDGARFQFSAVVPKNGDQRLGADGLAPRRGCGAHASCPGPRVSARQVTRRVSFADNAACRKWTEFMTSESDPAASVASRVAGVLDPEALARLRELDPEGQSKLLSRVAGAFGTSVARLLPQLKTALEARDMAAIRHVAHTLKSSSASIGAVKLSRLCADIESMSREGRFEGLPDAIAAFNSEVTAVLDALKPLLESQP
ncbi:MAG: Hpt domain-containing protein [Rhizobacter sp.]|nr:Hpt domain-containing protein [Rhizobacter sp.]